MVLAGRAGRILSNRKGQNERGDKWQGGVRLQRAVNGIDREVDGRI
jgi:hypothetical protein